jgi:hypothetical protein
MSLSNQDSSMVNRSGVHVVSEDDSLESSFHELGDGETQNIIELVFAIVEETQSEASSQEGSTFENSSFIMFVEGQKLSGGLSQSGEGKLNSPDFSLVLQAVFTNDL